jgi:hypothetical protein
MGNLLSDSCCFLVWNQVLEGIEKEVKNHAM